MKDKTRLLLDKAQDAIEGAEVLINAGKVSIAMGRAYYAMFYVAQALLYERNLEFSKHSGVHAAFGKEFAKSGELDPKFHRWLLEAFEARLDADYGVELSFQPEEVISRIDQAKEFLRSARSCLN